MSRSLLLITITGPDNPGITATLMKPIVESGHRIVDMGQSITHDLLSLSILLDGSEAKLTHQDLTKNLLFEAKSLKVNLDFKEIENAQVVQKSGEKYIVSCVSLQGITPAFISSIANVLAHSKINIQRIDNVSGSDFKSLDIAVMAIDNSIDWSDVKQKLISVSNEFKTDIAILKDNVWRRNKRLIVFDMDSTLINQEVIVELAKRNNVGEEVHQVTERAMNGELDFDQSLVERVKLLKGLSEATLQKVLEDIELTPGTLEFIQTVKKLGHKVAVISGGFSFFTRAIKERLGLDYAFANELEIKNGELTGKVKGSIVNAEKKAMLLELIAQQEGIELEQVVAIGDGANDLQMLAKAGLGIAFHAKPTVKETADHHMSHGPMTSILYFLGIPGHIN